MASQPNVGRTEGIFAVNDDGDATYTLPLWVPRGRGTVTPELAFSYSSRGVNGSMGVGWSLEGVPSIAWCRRTVAQDGFSERLHYDGSDGLCLGSDRLIPVSPAQLPEREYRTEREMFAKIVAYGTEDHIPDHFKIWFKNGKIATFGETSAARLEASLLQAGGDLEQPSLVRAPGNQVTVAWGLDRTEDRNGNAATVEYTKLEGGASGLWWTHMRPAAIRYAPNRRVEFRYETQPRPDPLDGFRAGVHVREEFRLIGVAMFGGPEGGAEELLREYKVLYQNDSITGRSLVDTFTECDHDGTCKAPLELDWSLGSREFEELDAGSAEAHRLTVADVNGDGRGDLIRGSEIRLNLGRRFDSGNLGGFGGLFDLRTLDVDGDQRTDVAARVFDGEQGPGSRWNLFLPSGGNYAAAPGVLDGWIENGNPREGDPVYFADLDGNGLVDFVSSKNFEPWSYRLNTGATGANRFAQATPTDIPRTIGFGNFAVDTDGDGRTELIAPSSQPGWHTTGLNALGGAEHGVANLWSRVAHRTHFGDINGDGLEDAIMPYPLEFGDETPLRVQLNGGNGFAALSESTPSSYVPPSSFPPGAPGDYGIRIVDFNRDGQDDLLVFHDTGMQLFVWKDDRFVQDAMSLEIGLPSGSWSNTQVLDMDGDGMPDIVNSRPDDGDDDDEDGDNRLVVFRRTGGVPDLLTGIGNPAFHARIEVDYTTLANSAVHTADTCTYPQACPVSGGTIVAEHRRANLVGTGDEAWDRYTHTYKGARNDLQGRGWLGFAEHTVTRPATGATTIVTLDNLTRDATTKAYPLAHLPKTVTYRFEPTDTEKGYQRIVDTGYDVRPANGRGYAVEPQLMATSEGERVAGGFWQVSRGEVTDTTYDDLGNPRHMVITSLSGRQTTVDIEYRNNLNSWLIGLPTRRVTTACLGEKCTTRESTLDYDTSGNPTLTVIEPNIPEAKLSIVTAYGQFGTIDSVTSTDNAGVSRTNTFEYGNAERLYPTATLNALGHRTVIETHSGLGVRTRIVDPNCVPVTMRHDRFGRLREINRADGSFEHIAQAYFGLQLTQVTKADGRTALAAEDHLGRIVHNSFNTFDGGTAVVTTNYDTLGRVHQVSRPRASGGPTHYTTFEYDRRDRLISKTTPDGAVRHEYPVLEEVHTYDAKGAHSFTEVNLDRQIENVYQDDPKSDQWLVTRFEYGPFGETTEVVAPDDTAQIMDYDVRGLRKSLVDPTTGTTLTTYNAFGEVASETNGANETTTYLYDELGRIKKVISPDGDTVHKWDTAPNGIGKPVNSTSPDGVAMLYRYEPLGRPASVRWTIDGTQYLIAYDYDDIGRRHRVTYPEIPGAQEEPLTVESVFNEHGFLEQVRDVATPEDPYWVAERRNPAGQLLEESYGNGVISSYEYQDSTGLLSAIDVTGPGDVGALAALSYVYDPNRNIDLRTDSLRSRTDDYGYDELNRLTTWTASNGRVNLTATYDYDVIGNLKSETVQGVPNQNATYGHGEDGAPPHALTSRNGAVYTYDDAGRQVTGPGRTIEYNRAGLPKSITRGQTGLRTEFAYDANGTRARKRESGSGGATVVYVGGLFERRVPAGTNGTEIHNLHNIVADGRVIAQINRVQPAAGGTPIRTSSSYLHRDVQGSTTLVTNSAGRTLIAEDFLPELFYDPWGRRIDSDYKPLGANRRGGPRQGFTGHEHEDEFGLINMIGRIYDPEARRFLTPDPFIQDPLSSQSHNRYSYVWNNPSTYTDPTGFNKEGGEADDDPAPRTQPGEIIHIKGNIAPDWAGHVEMAFHSAYLLQLVVEIERQRALAKRNWVFRAGRQGPRVVAWRNWQEVFDTLGGQLGCGPGFSEGDCLEALYMASQYDSLAELQAVVDAASLIDQTPLTNIASLAISLVRGDVEGAKLSAAAIILVATVAGDEVVEATKLKRSVAATRGAPGLPAPKVRGSQARGTAAPEHGPFVVDPHGNTIPTPPGGRVTSSPDGRWIQARNAQGNPTGVRLDGPHKPASHPDPRAQQPHGHVPGVTNLDGTPWLPVNQ